LKEKEQNPNVRYIVQQQVSVEKVASVKRDLLHLVSNPYSIDARALSILHALQNAGVEVPASRTQRVALFRRLSKQLRTQTGQRDFIEAGLARFEAYEYFLNRYFESKGLPHELLAI